MAPSWWGAADAGYPGVVLSGAALAEIGVAAPVLHRELAVLLRAERVSVPTVT